MERPGRALRARGWSMQGWGCGGGYRTPGGAGRCPSARPTPLGRAGTGEEDSVPPAGERREPLETPVPSLRWQVPAAESELGRQTAQAGET